MKKISQRSDALFTVRSYIEDDGRDAIEGWYGRQTSEVQAAFVVVLKTLRDFPQKWWRSTLFDELGHGGQTACIGLGRIRVVHKPKNGAEEQHRILAFLGPAENQITLLMAFEKAADPDYSLSCPHAQEKKAKVQNDTNRSRECRL